MEERKTVLRRIGNATLTASDLMRKAAVFEMLYELEAFRTPEMCWEISQAYTQAAQAMKSLYYGIDGPVPEEIDINERGNPVAVCMRISKIYRKLAFQSEDSEN